MVLLSPGGPACTAFMFAGGGPTHHLFEFDSSAAPPPRPPTPTPAAASHHDCRHGLHSHPPATPLVDGRHVFRFRPGRHELTAREDLSRPPKRKRRHGRTSPRPSLRGRRSRVCSGRRARPRTVVGARMVFVFPPCRAAGDPLLPPRPARQQVSL